jgi:hypothetical protein
MSVFRLRQVHGADVVVVGRPSVPGLAPWALSTDGRPPEADAVVSGDGRSCLVVLTADCGSVALGSPEGVFGAVHMGWRGLTAGVLGRAVEAMAALGARSLVAGLGPTVHPCCYAFGADELDAVAQVVGDEVRAVTVEGGSALDLPAGVRAVLGRAGIPLVVDLDRCTGCGEDGFSYRARADDARQGLFVWRTGSGAPS